MTGWDESGESDTGTADTGESGSDTTDGAAEPTAPDRNGPLSDLATAADERRSTAGTRERDAASASGPAFEDLFDREAVTEIDAERLWSELESETDPDVAFGGDDREIRDVDSGSYCHQCEHFSAPPTVACTREGTDILEMPALETFRVADCPVVREDERLERGY